jgi:aromatic ring-opening dioxygenase catalytic subunit (LigB family)
MEKAAGASPVSTGYSLICKQNDEHRQGGKPLLDGDKNLWPMAVIINHHRIELFGAFEKRFKGNTFMLNPNHTQNIAQIVYFSHGGGPLPILGDHSHKAMVDFMRQLPYRLKKPDAILVINAHWEEGIATLLGSQAPSMLYDYYGFPDEAYEITYPAPGSSDLAYRITGLLNQNGILARVDPQRGFDHGLYIPLKLMYPETDIPSLQLSLLRSLDPIAHLALGAALRELTHENVLMVGSGFSFHNMRAFSWGGGNAPDPANDDFQNWLIDVCISELSQGEREKRPMGWQKAPSARYCHPREEHLLLLHVCTGMANKSAKVGMRYGRHQV